MKKHTSLFNLLSICYIIILASNISCKKFIDIEPATELISTQAVFSDDKSALSAVEGVYALLRSQNPSFLNGILTIYPALCADELNTNTSSGEFLTFQNNSILSTSGIINSSIWSVAYRTIYRTNAIISGLDKSPTISIATKNQLTSEMKLVRALSYFYLTNLFGDVPLIISTDYATSASTARSPVSLVYEQIVQDLTSAKNNLSAVYPSPNRARPNKWTAAALLSRTYLYMKDWRNAEKESDEIINAGIYSLNTNTSSVFLIASNETIWQVPRPDDNGNTAEGSQFVPASTTTVPNFSITSDLLNKFEASDIRKTNWTRTNTVNGQPHVYPAKYKSRVATPVTEYNIIFRLAEQYLIRGEARLNLHLYSEACQDINSIRSRAGLSIINTADPNTIQLALDQERQIELLCEWGHRWFDLKRLNKINGVLAPLKGNNWQPADALYPLPFNELQLNPFLIQNPGYN